MKNFKSKFILFLLLILGFSSSNALTPEENYCIENNGKVVDLLFEIDTGLVKVETGVNQPFCSIKSSDELIGILDLNVYGSTTKSLAATFALLLTLNPDQKVPGPYDRWDLNLCYFLGGGSINYRYNGGFAGNEGQNGMCTFGDGSMISAWTLYMIAIGKREDIKNKIKSQPFGIRKPDIPTVSNTPY